MQPLLTMLLLLLLLLRRLLLLKWVVYGLADKRNAFLHPTRKLRTALQSRYPTTSGCVVDLEPADR